VNGWSYEAVDATLTRSLEGFIPAQVFDAHAHLYRLADLGVEKPEPFLAGGPADVGLAAWRRQIGPQVGRAHLEGGLFFPFPTTGCNLDRANDFLAEQLRLEPQSRGLMLISPDTPPARVEHYLEDPRIVGFKPYHTFSREQPTFQSSIEGFVPDWIWERADAGGLVITLHMVKDGAMADPTNQASLRRLCRTYPRVRLILAHCARGFHAPNTIRGLSALEGLENVWFDTSALCEATAMNAVLRVFGPQRLLWGSDFPDSEIRGKYVTIGDYFGLIEPQGSGGSAAHYALVGVESLRALWEAAETCGLGAGDVQDIFRNNARRLLDLDGPQCACRR
jgi:glutamate-1-semialdehyde 2,1-aminomutase